MKQTSSFKNGKSPCGTLPKALTHASTTQKKRPRDGGDSDQLARKKSAEIPDGHPADNSSVSDSSEDPNGNSLQDNNDQGSAATDESKSAKGSKVVTSKKNLHSTHAVQIMDMETKPAPSVDGSQQITSLELRVAMLETGLASTTSKLNEQERLLKAAEHNDSRESRINWLESKLKRKKKQEQELNQTLKSTQEQLAQALADSYNFQKSLEGERSKRDDLVETLTKNEARLEEIIGELHHDLETFEMDEHHLHADVDVLISDLNATMEYFDALGDDCGDMLAELVQN